MGSTTPPKRMTRARAAAASATATTLSTKTTKSDRVIKSAKATPSTKATAASAKKPAATKKAATTTATAATVAAPEKPAEVKKPVAKTATTASTTTTRPITRKRKAQTSDSDDEDDLCKEDTTQPTMNRPAKKLRGSAKKAVDPKTESESEHESESQSQSKSQEPDTQSSTAATTRPTRGRPKRSTTTATTPSTTTTETLSTTRGKRTRKTAPKADDAATTTKPAPKKRGRAATGTITTTYATEPTPGLKSAVSRPTSKPGAVLKKTVTFQEPEKENVPPKTAKKAKTETTTTTATGLRAKPVRKPAASGRTTRASARAAITDTTEKIPLSPKKDGQNLPLSRDVDSDDELATYEKTPLKPLMKSPVKPTRGVRKLELPAPEKEEDSDPSQTLESVLPSVLSSPARRPPPTPFKDTMKSPAKRLDGFPSLIFPSATTEMQDAQSPSKPTLLQSPAKRSHISLPAFQFNQEQVGTARSPMKMSFFGTPAKRPTSPLKLLSSSVSRIEEKPQEASKENVAILMEEEDDDADTTLEEDECILHTSIEETEDMETPTKEKNDMYSPTEEISEEELQSQIRAEIGSVSPNESVAVEKSLSPIPEADNEDSIQFESPTPTPQLSFPGRLSAVLPRYADPALKQNPLPVSGLPNHSTQLSCAEPQKLESPKNDLDAKAPSHEPMDGSDASPEKQPVELHTAESEAARIDASEEKSTEVLDACESNEQATAVSEPQCDKREAQAEDPNVLSPTKTTPTKAARKRAAFGSRGKQLEGDCMSDSEDELALSNKTITKHQDATSASDPQPVTPAPLFKGTDRKISESAARAASRAIRSVSKTSQLGFSVQLGAWRASSPLKGRQTPQKPAAQPEDDDDEFSLLDEKDFPVVETPSAKGFFDDEMKIRDDMENQAAIEALLEADIAAKFDKHDFHDLGLMDDISFVTEDERMSPPNDREADSSRSHDESISDASQEYGDENVVPIDPALVDNKTDIATASQNPVTPQKRTFASREVHTVSKVPLKRGDDSPPRSVKRHCSTVSKISLHRSSQTELQDQTDEESKFPLVTPSKSAPWSSMGTPARTTRPDLNPKLLTGAIVFVDVHTTEGADAGRIFVDLLVQMGARCVKSWPWNPSNTTDGQVDVSKIGITHVVFKDGGKRTLEKVVESNGAVQCVGVSWVLDCEKENRWVNEKDYRVDPALIPRGGHNRRKSMEPKAIANMNGTLVTPMKINSNARDLQMVPNNYMSRRDSTVWMRSPSDHDEDEDAPSEPSEMDWETTEAPVLTPVPKTPAPEMVARFAMDISPGTPTTSSFASTNELLMQTCPPKPAGLINIGESFVSGNQDPVSMRLMAARRKSMQFAPRVASPLKKQWK
ncbi:hypothetical protein F4860DRAFT_177605 [Xylaria cubensis]|nr:hypothetical protein F4860DRAFT_177605 [Xylaria cubensis]